MRSLSRNFIQSLYGQFARLVLQAVFFFFLAKILPIDEFGFFSLIIAISALLLPFSGWGSQLLLVKLCSIGDQNYHARLGASIRVTIFTGMFLSLVAAVISEKTYFDSMFRYVFSLFITEVVIYRIFESFASSYQGRGEFKKIVNLRITVPLIKFIAVLIIYFNPGYFIYENKFYWVYVYFLCSIIGLIIYLTIYIVKNRTPKDFIFNRVSFNYSEGLMMSSSLLVYGVFSSTDQIMIGSMISSNMVAVYALSAKIYFMLFLPFQALSTVTIRNFFRYGYDNTRCVNELRKILKVCLPTSVTLSLITILMSGILPHIFGENYELSKDVLLGLMLAFPLKVCSAMISDYLVGIGKQKVRLSCEIFSCLVNIMMNYILISLYGVIGAVFATLLSELTLVILFFSIYFKTNRAYR